MNTSNFLFSLFITTIIISSCAISRKQAVVQQAPKIIEKERIISKPFDAVWQTSIEWFAIHNIPIKNLDKSSGLISTEYSVSLGDADRYMSCGKGSASFTGKVELTNYTGNFNVLIKKLGDNSTKISVNVFFGCTVNNYKYKGLLSTEYVLVSSSRITCTSTGALEREILDYLEAGN